MKKNKIIGMLTSLLLVFSTFGSQIPVYAQEQTDTQEVNQNNGFTEDQGEVQEEQQESQEEGQLEITGDLTLSESQNTEEEVSVSLFNLVPQNLDSIYDGTAYFYILKPGETADSNRTPDEKWYGISTTGTVNLTNPSTQTLNTKYPIGNVTSYPSSYPAITGLDGNTYRYDANAATNQSPYTYYIIWDYIIVSDGANVGYNQAGPYVPNGTKTYHVDGHAVMFSENKVQVTFYYQPVNQTDFVLAKNPEMVNKNTTRSSIAQPSMENQSGYVFDGWYLDEQFTQKVNFDSTQIKTNETYYGHYVPASINYSVNYYYDGNLSETITSSATYGLTINEYIDKCKDGYTLDRVQGLPLTIGADEKNNVINVYYAKDENKNGIPDKYEVKITYNAIHGTFDGKETVTQDYVIAQKDANNNWIPIEKTLENIPVPVPDTGYKEGSWDIVPTATTKVKENTTYTYTFTQDETAVDTLSYKVNHIIKDSNVIYKTSIVTQNVWVNDPQLLTVTEESIQPLTIKGYKYDSISENGKAGTKVNNQAVISLYYVKDESQTKDLSYTVEYYKDGALSDTDIVTESVWVLSESDRLNVKKEDINTVDKYKGYAFDYTDPSVIPDTIKNEGIIKVYYEKDVHSTIPGNPEQSDGIPDKYQVRVNFKAVNGIVSFDYTYVTLYDENGNWSQSGVGHLNQVQIPSSKADKGYKDGKWDVLPTVDLNITKEETFTITYQREEINKNKTENKTNKKQVNTSTITNSSRYGFMMLISIVSIVCLLKKRK